ncbi:AI-2E family transporter [Natronorubrum thiooxidans]|uniref:Predicted PurR-regulated permease PerM n=1 Tax=Natronorubrum thiooxidans TaxID=308853 RepID=A0A1N7FTD7_9EURY|nr:AI-2E family transporter [Natronorubrum thiooxidans]SIS03527.1 Predicted PurR-regulated permease PerM [Natronorubrum thiooxidans]
MSDRADPPGWFAEGRALTALAVVSVALAAFIILPYLQYVLLGVVLAYVLAPAQRRLERVISPMLAALALVVVAILTILLPVAYVLAIALRQALELVSAIQDGTLNATDIEQRLEDAGVAVDLAEMYGAYQEPIATGLQGLATSGIEFVSGLPGILIGITVTLFVLFALLRDGERLVAWSQSVIPIDDEIQQELLAELDQLMWASVVGNVGVAAIQAMLLGVGLAVLNVPAVILLTVGTFVFTLLPLIGAFGIWLPVVIYLLAVGEVIPAAALVVYGSLISASDTYLRPALIGRTSAFNSAIIVVGIFGGLVVFGAVGLFIGPVVLGGAKVTLDVFARERSRELQWETEAAGEDVTGDAAVDTESETGISDTGEERDGTDDDRETAAESPAAGETEETATGPQTEPDTETAADSDTDPPP